MDWPEALDLVVARTRHERYRQLCADDHPDHEAWRDKMVAKAEAYAGRPVPEYPPFATQVGNALAAAGRVVSAVVHGEAVMASSEVQAERLATCEACVMWDACQRRCTACGCGGLKIQLLTERCPLGKWPEIPS